MKKEQFTPTINLWKETFIFIEVMAQMFKESFIYHLLLFLKTGSDISEPIQMIY